MRKTLSLLLCAVLALSLTACGAAAPENGDLEPLTPVETPAAVGDMEDASAAEALTPASEPEPEDDLPASATDAVVDEEALAAAEACVGQPVEALYEAVGEPTGGAQYAASCLEENAEDGMLFYDELGFYVWTVKGAAEEIVHEVYLLD